MVYSPSLHTPREQKDRSLMLAVGGGALPETVPETADKNLSGGMEGRVGYHFSNNVAMEAKYFFSIPSMDSGQFFDHGFGGILTINLQNEDEYSIKLVGQGQFTIEEETFQGGGGTIQVGAVWKPNGALHGYAFIGPVLGSYDWFEEWGLGAASNLGCGVTLGDNFTITGEAAVLLYYDSFKDVTRTAISPSIQIAFLLPTHSN